MSVTTVRLEPEIEQNLQVIADSMQKSKSWIINQAVKEYLGHHELEIQRRQETLQAMESVTQGEVVSDKAVQRWVNSLGTANEIQPPKVGT